MKVDLVKISKEIRKDILLMSFRAKSAHTGGALSVVEILVALYFKIMKVFSHDSENPLRDRLIFSKAHDAKALYATLAERGFFDKKILEGYEQNDGLLPGHSTRHCVPGVEASAGALGHGLSMAAGMAYAGKIDKKKYKVFAVLSDGECDEGSVWEAALFAGHHNLDNLVVIVDYNKLQGYGYTKDVLDLEPFVAKWQAFGWQVREINGHSFPKIIDVFQKIPFQKGRPSIVIANTIKGLGGVPIHVDQVSSQYKPPNETEVAAAIAKLEEV
ncbi:transketolase [Candidatus Gottesmanbacteria bacterium]|nr:transketolase [Candidatus Gottesmanbacteria bacterium]